MFDAMSARPRRRGTMVASAGFHVLLGGFLLVGPLWGVQEPPEPDVKMPVIWFPPKPEEPIRVTFEKPQSPGGNPNAGRPNAAPVHASRPRETAPTRIPDLLPAASQVAAVDETPEGSGPFPVESVGPGKGDEPGPGGEPGRSTEIVSADAPDVTRPVPVYTPDPPYPNAARIGHIQGVVFLEAVIGADGNVRDVRVMKSVNPLLDRAAVDTVLRWRYRAAFVETRPVAVYLEVRIGFQLR